jgi:hypothetical protein
MNSLLEMLADAASEEFNTSFTKYLDSNGSIFEIDQYELYAHGRDIADFLKNHQENTPETQLALQFLLEGWGLNSGLNLDFALIPMLHGRLQDGLDLIVKNADKKNAYSF